MATVTVKAALVAAGKAVAVNATNVAKAATMLGLGTAASWPIQAAKRNAVAVAYVLGIGNQALHNATASLVLAQAGHKGISIPANSTNPSWHAGHSNVRTYMQHKGQNGVFTINGSALVTACNTHGANYAACGQACQYGAQQAGKFTALLLAKGAGATRRPRANKAGAQAAAPTTPQAAPSTQS